MSTPQLPSKLRILETALQRAPASLLASAAGVSRETLRRELKDPRAISLRRLADIAFASGASSLEVTATWPGGVAATDVFESLREPLRGALPLGLRAVVIKLSPDALELDDAELAPRAAKWWRANPASARDRQLNVILATVASRVIGAWDLEGVSDPRAQDGRIEFICGGPRLDLVGYEVPGLAGTNPVRYLT